MFSQKSVNQQLQQAQFLIQKKDFQSAVSLLRPLCKSLNKNADAWNMLGIAAKNINSVKVSEEAFKKCLTINPLAFGALNNLGNLYVQNNQMQQAINCFKEALNINSKFWNANFNLGNTLLKIGKLDDAEKEFFKTLDLEPNNYNCLSSIAFLYQQQELFSKALEYYDKALEVSPNFIMALQNKAIILKIQQRYQDSIKLFQKVISIHPGIADTYHNLGGAYASIGEGTIAIDNFNKALKLEPTNPTHHHWLNQMLWSEGSEFFLSSYYDAIKKYPNKHNLRRDLVYKLIQADRLDDAYSELQYLVENDSVMPMNYKLLGTVQRKLDQFDAAVKSHLTAITLEPSSIIFQEELATSYLSAGDANAALRIIDNLLLEYPIHQGYWALKATALRILKSDEYHYLYDYEKLVLITKIEPPNGYNSLLEFNSEVKEEINKYHLNKEHPLDQSLVSGTQSIGDLFAHPSPILQQLRAAFDEQIKAFISQLPKDDNHPVLNRNNGKFCYSGAWSVLLRNSGFHRNHFHSHGWYSGPYYVDLPKVINDSSGNQGWVKFGEPGFNSVVSLPADFIVKPEVGMMVRFPSYMWHGTIPFKSDETRLIVATDIEP